MLALTNALDDVSASPVAGLSALLTLSAALCVDKGVDEKAFTEMCKKIYSSYYEDNVGAGLDTSIH